MNRRKRTHRKSVTYQAIEKRLLLAAIYHNPVNGILYINGDSGNNVGQVSVSNGDVVAQIDGSSLSVDSDEVTDIVFIGRDGNDTFTNLSERSTTMYGHLGADTLIGGSGDDNLIGGPGNDTISGLDGNDRVVGADGNDTLDGGDGDDRIFGTAGQNVIHGGNGNDTIYGSEDSDEIFGDAGADRIYALGGNDVIYTGAGGTAGGSFAEGDVAMGHSGDDQFFGTSGLDIFYGGDGNDTMTGGAGENRMHGQGGDDSIVGGQLGDYMTGAEGDDSFDGRGGVDFYNAGEGEDTIIYYMDYSPSDVFVTTSGETRIEGEKVDTATWIRFNDRIIYANQANYSIRNQANFSSLNGYRISNLEAFLSKPSDLAAFATAWSTAMANQNQLANSSSSDRASLLIGDRSIFRENVGTVSDTGQSEIEISNYFHNYFQSVSLFNNNMLQSNLLEVGVGIVKSNGAWWATQIFAG